MNIPLPEVQSLLSSWAMGTPTPARRLFYAAMWEALKVGTYCYNEDASARVPGMQVYFHTRTLETPQHHLARWNQPTYNAYIHISILGRTMLARVSKAPWAVGRDVKVSIKEATRMVENPDAYL